MALYVFPPVSLSTSGLATEAKQDIQITALNAANASLDAIEATDFATEAKQDSQITELQTLNATDFATEAKQDTQITALNAANASLDAIEADADALNAKTASAMVTEAHDYQAITYVGATTDIDTITYKSGGAGGTTVATLTMGYDGSNRLTSVTKT